MRDKLLKTFALMAIAASLALAGCNSGDEHAGESASEPPEESAGANAAEHVGEAAEESAEHAGEAAEDAAEGDEHPGE